MLTSPEVHQHHGCCRPDLHLRADHHQRCVVDDVVVVDVRPCLFFATHPRVTAAVRVYET